MAYNYSGNQPVSGNSNGANRPAMSLGPQSNPYNNPSYNAPRLAQPMPQAQPSYVINVNNTIMDESQIPSRFQALSPLAYFGYTILFAIPLVGIIFILVYAFGACENVNLRNYARSYFCVYIVVMVIAAVMFAMALILGVSFQMYLNRYI